MKMTRSVPCIGEMCSVDGRDNRLDGALSE